MKIYIAGKITGLPRAEIERKFNSAAEKLKAGGMKFSSPPFCRSIQAFRTKTICMSAMR